MLSTLSDMAFNIFIGKHSYLLKHKLDVFFVCLFLSVDPCTLRIRLLFNGLAKHSLYVHYFIINAIAIVIAYALC